MPDVLDVGESRPLSPAPFLPAGIRPVQRLLTHAKTYPPDALDTAERAERETRQQPAWWLDAARERASKIDFLYDRAFAWCQIASTAFILDRGEQARQALREGIKAAKDSPDRRSCIQPLIRLARLACNCGDVDGVKQAAREALERIQENDDEGYRRQWIARTAGIIWRSGDKQWAQQIYHAAVPQGQIGDGKLVNSTLDFLGGGLPLNEYAAAALIEAGLFDQAAAYGDAYCQAFLAERAANEGNADVYPR